MVEAQFNKTGYGMNLVTMKLLEATVKNESGDIGIAGTKMQESKGALVAGQQDNVVIGRSSPAAAISLKIQAIRGCDEAQDAVKKSARLALDAEMLLGGMEKRLLWSRDSMDQITIGSDGTVLATSAPHGDELCAYDPEGNLLWKKRTISRIMPPLHVTKTSEILAIDFDGHFYSKNTANGNDRFDHIWRCVAPHIKTTMLSRSGAFYILTDDHWLWAVDPETVKTKWTFDTRDLSRHHGTGSEVYSFPREGPDGTIYVGSHDKYFYAVTPDGRLKWRFKTGAWVNSSAAFRSDGTIYVGSQDGHLYALDPSGNLKWSYRTDGWVDSSPCVGKDGLICFGSNDGCVYALNPDGSLRWRFKTGGPVIASPVISPQGEIFVGSNDGNLYAIDAEGRLSWMFRAGSPINEAVTPGPGNRLYFVTKNRRLYALDSRPEKEMRRITEEKKAAEMEDSVIRDDDGFIIIGGVRLPVREEGR